MKNVLAALGLLLFSCADQACCQETTTTQMQVEDLAAETEEETEDDSFLQLLQQFRQHPLNLNYASAVELQGLRMLNPLQVDALLSYRKLIGPLISIYELQAVPLWDLEIIQRLLPFITISERVPVPELLMKRFKGGSHVFYLRNARVLQQQKGYDGAVSNSYRGGPDHLLFRYRYSFKNLLQAGVTGDKDAGEPFFKGAQSKGFDFYSAHLFARAVGMVRAVALGDYTVNLGQGLIQWQSMAFKKGGNAVHIKRQSPGLLPYSSAGEYNFYRGGGMALAKENVDLVVFGSKKSLSATEVTDTVAAASGAFSSLSTSGYHRTEGELRKRNSVKEGVVGGSLHYTHPSFRIGFNGLHYNYSKSLQEAGVPYTRLSARASSGYNLSLDYSATFRNAHLFGEAAVSKDGGKALITGLLVALDARADLAMGYRNLSPSFQPFRGNAFTESSLPSNEEGLYAGIAVRPMHGLKLEAYADHYVFPSIRYRIDAPGAGQDYLVQVTYQPRKGIELYTRFRSEKKPINAVSSRAPLNIIVPVPRQSWRLHLNYRFTPTFLLKARADLVWYHKKSESAEEGFLMYMEGAFDIGKVISGNVRLQCFETGGYSSRVYAFESDVLYGYSVPSFFDNGTRYYANMNWDITSRITLWIKWAQTIFRGKEMIGSGLEEIKGNIKSEIKVQLRLKL